MIHSEINELVAILRRMFPKGAALHEPKFELKEKEYVADCLESGWVSSAGAYIEKFENNLCQITGHQHAIATVNGTAALQVILQTAGMQQGSEVLLPSLTFVGTANAILNGGGIPHFVDSEPHSLGPDPRKLENYLERIVVFKDGEPFNQRTSRRIFGLVPVHLFGHPVRGDSLKEICSRYKLQLIEDAAESLGSKSNGRHVGHSGLAAILSFNGNKIVTTGGGGAILTNHSELAARTRHVVNTARLRHSWEFLHDMQAFNFRMPNINAALGLGQLERIDTLVTKKRSLHAAYRRELRQISMGQLFAEQAGCNSNHWFNVFLLSSPDRAIRDAILQSTNQVGIQTRPVWKLLHQLEFLKGFPKDDLSQAEILQDQIICMPGSPHLADEMEVA